MFIFAWRTLCNAALFSHHHDHQTYIHSHSSSQSKKKNVNETQNWKHIENILERHPHKFGAQQHAERWNKMMKYFGFDNPRFNWINLRVRLDSIFWKALATRVKTQQKKRVQTSNRIKKKKSQPKLTLSNRHTPTQREKMFRMKHSIQAPIVHRCVVGYNENSNETKINFRFKNKCVNYFFS